MSSGAFYVLIVLSVATTKRSVCRNVKHPHLHTNVAHAPARADTCVHTYTHAERAHQTT